MREKQDFDSQEEVYAEESIYKKFTSKEDNAIMPTFHKADWKEKFVVLQKFKDERLSILEKKYFMKKVQNLYLKMNMNLFIKKLQSRVLSTNKENGIQFQEPTQKLTH